MLTNSGRYLGFVRTGRKITDTASKFPTLFYVTNWRCSYAVGASRPLRDRH